MAQITGPIGLAAATNPTAALANKFSSGAYQIFDNAPGSSGYFVNGVDRGDGSDGPILAARPRGFMATQQGRVGYHRKGGECLYILIRPGSTATYDSAGGTGSTIFIQEAVFDADSGMEVDRLTHEYADFNSDTGNGGIPADPVLTAGRDNVAYATDPLPPGTFGVVYGAIQIDLDTA